MGAENSTPPARPHFRHWFVQQEPTLPMPPAPCSSILTPLPLLVLFSNPGSHLPKHGGRLPLFPSHLMLVPL